jgi:photoactive yellow protein
MSTLPSFDTPDLAQAVELLPLSQIDLLPFGATRLDAANLVRFRNKTEIQISPVPEPTDGRLFFTDVAPCMNNAFFKGRIDAARSKGSLDISFNFTGDYTDRSRELNVRVQSASDGGVWIFLRRPTSN